MYLVDANVFLELQLNQQKADDCERFLEAVCRGEMEAYITDLILDSILIVMEDRGKSSLDLETFLVALASYNGLKLYFLSLVDRLESTRLMEEFQLDFEDSTLVQAARRLKVDTVVSFDRHLDHVKHLRRIEPSDLMKLR